MHRRKTTGRHREKADITKPRREVSEGNNLVHTLIFYFHPPGL